MIDITTLFVALVLAGMLIAAILAIVSRGTDTSLTYWAAGYGINSLAFALLAMRGMVPDLFSVVLANSMIACSYALYVYGLLKFLQQSVNPLVIWGPVLTVVITFPFFAESVATRIFIIGLVNAYQSFLIFRLLLSNSHRLQGRGKIILAVTFAAGGLIALSRPVALTLGLLEVASVNSPGAFQNLTFLTVLLINIAIAMGLVLMLKEQAEYATSAIARTDDLTGLPNRRSIYERINTMMLNNGNANANAKGQQFGALLLIDLDNFKTINDQHGHAMGDELLRQTASRLSECITTKDTVARLGGDEFVVLLSELSDDRRTALALATERTQQIREKLDEHYTLRHDIVHHCPGSIGLAIFEPGMKDRETFLRQADHAMYDSKKRNKLKPVTDDQSCRQK